MAIKRYSDIDLNFKAHPIKKDIIRLVDDRAVVASVRNLLMTGRYERPFQPYIGSSIRRLLFEPLDHITATNLERAITETIGNFEPRVTINQLQVVPDYENNRFGVFMEFTIINRPDVLSVKFLLERIR